MTQHENITYFNKYWAEPFYDHKDFDALWAPSLCEGWGSKCNAQEVCTPLIFRAIYIGWSACLPRLIHLDHDDGFAAGVINIWTDKGFSRLWSGFLPRLNHLW